MSYVILGFFLVAIVHFVYEFIMAPLLRLETRADITCLRHDLRKMRSNKDIPSGSLAILSDAVKSLEHLYTRWDISTFRRFERLESQNKDLRENVERRRREVERCTDPGFIKARKRMAMLAIRSFVINAGAWAIYIVPVVLVIAFASRCIALVKDLLSTPEQVVQQLAPPAESLPA
jgi:hypothetical protein